MGETLENNVHTLSQRMFFVSVADAWAITVTNNVYTRTVKDAQNLSIKNQDYKQCNDNLRRLI